MSHITRVVPHNVWMSRMSHATRTNESCHTYEWVTMSHASSKGVCATQMNEYGSCNTYEWAEWVMSHVQTSHVTQRMNEPCYTTRGEWSLCHTHEWEWVMSHIWMSHVIQRTSHGHVRPLSQRVMCHTYECFISRVQMSHVTQINESRRTYEWVMSRIRMSQVTQRTGQRDALFPNESYGTYKGVMSHIWMSHITQRASHGDARPLSRWVMCDTYE